MLYVSPVRDWVIDRQLSRVERRLERVGTVHGGCSHLRVPSVRMTHPELEIKSELPPTMSVQAVASLHEPRGGLWPRVAICRWTNVVICRLPVNGGLRQ